MNYSYPRLVKTADKWYISFYTICPITDTKKRHRPTEGMNRIKNKRKREQFARSVIAEIWRKLPNGYPYNEDKTPLGYTNIIDAITKMATVKEKRTDKTASIKNIRYHSKKLNNWLISKQLDHLQINQLKISDCIDYKDFITVQLKLAGTTWNNGLQVLSSIFEELKKRQYISTNLWKELKKEKTKESARRPFPSKKVKACLNFIAEYDIDLLFPVYLIYYAGIRPREIARLQVRDFDIDRGLIHLSEEKTKNGFRSSVTMAKPLKQLCIEKNIDSYPSTWFVINSKLKIGAQSVGNNRMYRRHRKALIAMYEKEILDDLEKLTLYSWKDTGVNNLFEHGIDVNKIRDHLRHSDISTTNKYVKRRRGAIEEIANIS